MTPRKRLLLITPPYHAGVVESAGRWPNVGLAYVGGQVRAAGFEVSIYDAMTKEVGLPEIAARIREFRPDFVGCASYTASFPAAMDVLRTAKEVDPRIVTLMGGIHANFMYDEILRDHPDVDFVVRGEGELTTPQLLRALAEPGAPGAARVRGIAYRAGEGAGLKIAATPPQPFVPDLDRLAPAWDLLDWEDYTFYVLPGSRLGIVSSSRGCLNACNFCSQQRFWHRTYRQRSAESFVAELEHLRDLHGVTVVMLADEYPTLDAERWHRILDLLIEREVGVYLLLETVVGDIIRDRHLLEKYRRAGVVHVYLGVEATTDDRLASFNKNVRVRDSREALRLLNQAGIVTECSFVLGMPDDTAETVEQTLELAYHYDADMPHFLLIAPWPYADLYPQLEPHIITRDYSKYNFVEPVVKPRAMAPEELKGAVLRCYRDYYSHKAADFPRLADSFKRDYLCRSVEVMMKNSFLARHMQAAGAGMPAWVREMLEGFKAPVAPR